MRRITCSVLAALVALILMAGCANEAKDGPAATGSKSVAGTSTASAGQAAPTSPVSDGEDVKTLGAPPERSLAFLSLPEGFKGARFRLSGRPFGWTPAPDKAQRLQLIVSVDEAVPMDDGAKALTQVEKGVNLVVVMEGPFADRELVAIGGEYEFEVSVRQEGGAGSFRVESVKQAK